jgi:asparagine synthase (glutamine-hydrolysing)
MCGIAGLFDPALAGARQALEAEAGAMADAIAHRGPDGAGVWSDPAAGLALAHRRLAIVDLTPSGAQPMLSADGRWVISYNGEIYNAAEMRRAPELADVVWRGTSDTEVILESVARRGLDRTLADMNGMFAIALWDRERRALRLIRDRMGIKPLFYGARDGAVRFASELKSFFAAGRGRFGIDPASVASFLRFGYVPAPWSILRGVAKLMPGEIVSFDAHARESRRQYWSMRTVAAEGLAKPLDLSDVEAETQLHDLLADAVSRQMISDVPLGAFLSGGIDSSLVSALMVAAGRGPVRTFSIGFPDFGFDESPHAAAVAKHLGTTHTELFINGQDALDVVPRLADMYDEPFADSSQIPTHLVSKLTRKHVTVALSGDGGDELFGGYNRYLLAQRLWERLSWMPRPMRQLAACAIRRTPDRLLDAIGRIAPRGVLPGQFADKAKKFADVLPLQADGLYLRLVSQYAAPAKLTAGLDEHPLAFGAGHDLDGDASLLRQMQLRDTITYLPDDILQKVDRASMAVALEARPPLLDHRVVSFAWHLPDRFHIRDGETKWLLRRVLDRHVPRALIDRPKMGFGVPLADWLRGPLRGWAEDLLDEHKLDTDLINARQVGALWSEHVSGRRNWAYALWNVLMFESWRRRWAANLV